MPPRCCIVQCSSRMDRNKPQITFHRTPKNEILRKKWLSIIGEENINHQLKDLFVCSLHFEESSFNRTLNIVRLRDDSVPSTSILVSQQSSALYKQKSSSYVSEKSQLKLKDSCPSTCVKLTKQGASVLCETSNTHRAHSPAQISQEHNKEIADKTLTAKQGVSVLCETSNTHRAHSPAEISQEHNEEIPVKTRNTETVRKLSLRCSLQRNKIKRLHDKLRKRNIKIALLLNIIDDLKQLTK